MNNKIITYKNSFIVQKELRKLVNIIKDNIFKNNGILFGDVVANILLVKYHKDRFEKKGYNYNKFWNTDYDIETVFRTETINKIDVYFENIYEYTKFVTFLKKSKLFEIIFLKNIDNPIHINNIYEISTRLGKTLTYEGYPINLSINIIMKMPSNNKYLEPPFNNAKFLTDILIMTRNREYKISKNTGIDKIDNMDIIEKSNLLTKVLTELSKKNNYILCKDVTLNNEIAQQVLEYNRNEWKIINSPLILTKCSNYFKNMCYICQYELNYDDDMILIDNISQCMLHSECCNKYLEKILEKKETIICPLRQYINFIRSENNLVF